MRVFIVFLLLACLFITGASASESKGIAVSQKAIKKSGQFFNKVDILAKKNSHSLSKGPFSDHVDFIHQARAYQNLALVMGLPQGTIISDQSTPLATIRLFKNTANYSYRFIFNCLFPKHVFW